MKLKKKHIAKKGVSNYATVVAELKERIRSAQILAVRSANRELITLYFDIGKIIVSRQNEFGWGKSIVEKLARDLRIEFPEQKGFSPQQLWFMRQMYVEFSGHSILLQLARELPWYHIVTIMTKVKDVREREYYLRAAASYGWSRAILTHQIETGLYQRQVQAKKTHNFKRLLPAKQAFVYFSMDSYIQNFPHSSV